MQDQIWDKRCLDQGLKDVGTNGPYVKLFRNQVAAECDVEPENVFLSNSGTSALELSLQQLDLGLNIIVVMPAMNFIASVNVVRKAGFAVHLVDVNPDTLLMDFDERLDKTCKDLKRNHNNVIIMPTLLYGATYDYRLPKNLDFNYIDGVIFDACEAFGSDISMLPHVESGKMFYCYSFNNNKILTTGGGGAIVAGRRHISDISARNKQGSYDSWIGENKGMPSLNAQLGYHSIINNTFSCDMKRKREIYDHYKLCLGDIVKFQKQGNGNYWYTFIMFPNYISKNLTINEFDELGIPYRLPFQAFNPFCNAKRANHLGLCLPSSPQMLKFYHLVQVVDIIKKAVKRYA